MTKEQDNKDQSSGRRLKEIFAVLGRYNLIHGVTPEKLRHILEDLGPTFVKLGQIMSMRPDMLPGEYCKELTHLRTEVKPIAFGDVIRVLEDEYGQPWDQIFRSVEETPLGSASIAQVHGAVRKDGRAVVLKVQRPGIHERMSQDIKLLHKASGVINIISKTGRIVDLNTVLDEMWEVAKQEMDFLAEAEHIRQFTKLNEDVRYVAFPMVEWDLTTSRVLCMEQVDGIPIDDLENLKREGYDLADITQKLAANYVKQVLEDGFFHADPHPGNIRIRDGKIVWMDLGMVGRLSVRDRQLFKKAMLAVVTDDVYELKTAVLLLSRHTGKINHNRLSEDLDDFLTQYGSLELGNVDVGKMILDVIHMAYTNELSMPGSLSMLGRGIVTLEGVISKIDPETSVMGIFSTVLSQSLWEDFNWRRELEREGRMLYGIGKKSLGASANFMEILKLASKGQAKLNIELTGSEEPFAKLSGMVNRLVVCILSAALFIGSSLLCMTGMQPRFLGIPLLGAAGYCTALIMIIWLILGILKRKKRP